MNLYVTWAASMVAVVCGLLSSWVLRQRPRWATRAAALMAVGGVVAVGNEALRTEATAYVGVWMLIFGTTFMNWLACRQSELDHRRRVNETLDLLAEMSRVQRHRDALIARSEAAGAGIWPPKEC